MLMFVCLWLLFFHLSYMYTTDWWEVVIILLLVVVLVQINRMCVVI